MKGSKKFGKSILVVVLSLILIISAVAPLAVMGSENYGGGSNGTGLGQYRYYSVKSGDTMASIAQKNGITISDIMTYNNLDSDDTLYRGQVLKLPITSANAPSSIVSSKITIKAKDASVKDVVSAIAYNAGYTVIFKGTDSKISVEFEDMSPMKALDYVTRFAGLSYLKDGNTLLISTPEDLNTTFVDSLVLTKFTLKYITHDELMGQASALGLSSMKTVSQSNNQREIWISAYPKEMAKLKELVEILDASENISVGSNSIAAAFTPIKLNYITASEFSSLLGSLGLHTGITMTSYPMTLFVYVSGVQLSDIMTIKKVVDTKEALDNILGDGGTTTPGGSTGDNTTPNPDDSTNTNPDDSTNTNPDNNTNTNPDDSTTEEPIEEPTVFERIDLVNITRSDAEALIAKSGEQVSTYGHDRMTKSLWLFGTQSAIDAVKSFIAAVDENVASAADTVHTYTAQNCTVDELMKRLQGVTYENVSFYQYDHSDITNNIIVYCDDATWNNEILPLLQKLDSVDGDNVKTWIPITSQDGNATATLTEKVNTLKGLYPDAFSGVEIRYIFMDGKTVVYANATSAEATRIKNIISAFDNA